MYSYMRWLNARSVTAEIPTEFCWTIKSGSTCYKFCTEGEFLYLQQMEPMKFEQCRHWTKHYWVLAVWDTSANKQTGPPINLGVSHSEKQFVKYFYKYFPASPITATSAQEHCGTKSHALSINVLSNHLMFCVSVCLSVSPVHCVKTDDRKCSLGWYVGWVQEGSK